MNIYSPSIISFISLLKKYSIEILGNEMGLKIRGKRFGFRGLLYPVNIVVFERKNFLGHFDSSSLLISINKLLMYSAKTEVIKNVLRHELAHYLCFLEYQNQVEPHGMEFREICQRFNWNKEIFGASFNVISENEKIEGDLPSERVIEKVKKLISLSQSSNANEAELAMIKANNLILAHNLERLDQKPDEFTYLERVLSGKKATGKTRAIYEILKEFFVYPVFNYGREGFYLEVIGTKENVEVADYVANFLDLELEKIWGLQTIKGVSLKNSFMEGLAEGFIKKLKQEKVGHFSGNFLIKIEEDLNQRARLVYPRLSKKTLIRGLDCEKAKNLGRKEGVNLKIRNGISNKERRLISG
jgi:hypothetical protein